MWDKESARFKRGGVERKVWEGLPRGVIRAGSAEQTAHRRTLFNHIRPLFDWANLARGMPQQFPAMKGVIPIRITSRDMDILRDLFANGELSRSDITDRYFNGSRTYTYRRLQMLKNYGLIRGRRRREDGRVIAVYELTDDGKNLLVQTGRIAGRKPKQIATEQPKKRNRAREWTERDIAILHKLYQVRVLTKSQLEQTFFRDSERYGSKRLEVMRKEQLVTSKVAWSRDKGSLEASYRITEKGLRLLAQKGLISEGEVRARDLEPTEKQREYIFDVNELHLKCQSIPFVDSRLIKRKYHLNRGDLVAGAFTWGGLDYMIYRVNSGANHRQNLERDQARPERRGRIPGVLQGRLGATFV